MRVKTVFLVLALLAVAIVPMLASAQAIDEFIYPPATALGGQSGGTGWAAAWGTSAPFANAFQITNGGLAFPGLLTAGNATQAAFDGSTWAYNNRPMTASYGAANQATWMQFLIRPDTGYGQWGAMVLGGGYWQPGAVQVGLNTDESGRYLFIQHQPSSGSPVTYRTPFAYNVNQTYLVQGLFQVDPTGALVDVNAWVWANNIAPAATVGTSGLYWGGVNNNLQLYSSGNYTYDQFRIGDRPDDPVPEAGTMVALGSFVSMGGLFLRRRFAKS